MTNLLPNWSIRILNSLNINNTGKSSYYLNWYMLSLQNQRQNSFDPLNGNGKRISQTLSKLNDDLKDRFKSLKDFLLSLGDDVQMKILKYYIAFKHIKNFACVEVHIRKNVICVYVKANTLHPGFTRDVRKIGHFGTGDLEITLKSHEDFERAQELLIKSYDVS